MTEQQIQEMVGEVERCGVLFHTRKKWEFAIVDDREEGAGVSYHIVRDGIDVDVTVMRSADTPIAAIRAAIAMIDRLETALQEDA